MEERGVHAGSRLTRISVSFFPFLKVLAAQRQLENKCKAAQEASEKW